MTQPTPLTAPSTEVFVPCWPTESTPADLVQLVVDQPDLTAAVLGLPEVSVAAGWPKKLAVAEMVPSSTPGRGVQVHMAPVAFEVSRAASASRRSFDLFPGISCVHLLVRTACDRTLTTQRSASTTFFPSAWSLTCEEQLDVGPDATLGDVVRRGLLEELNVPSRAVVSSLVLTAGDEHDLSVQPAERLGVAFLCQVELSLSWAELKDVALDAHDIHELQQLAAIGPCASSDLLAAFPGTSGPEELCARVGVGFETMLLVPEPGAPAGWHPTAFPRLQASASVEARPAQ